MHAAVHRHAASQSAGARNDLEFVAQLLGDPASAASGLNAPSSVPCTRRHKAAKKRPRAASREAHVAVPSQDARALLTRYNSPTHKSDSKRYFCEACSCSVSARDNDWDIHVSGVKHQRQLVSLLHTGQLGNTVVSLFEAEPGTGRVYCCPGTKRCLTQHALALQFPNQEVMTFPRAQLITVSWIKQDCTTLQYRF